MLLLLVLSALCTSSSTSWSSSTTATRSSTTYFDNCTQTEAQTAELCVQAIDFNSSYPDYCAYYQDTVDCFAAQTCLNSYTQMTCNEINTRTNCSVTCDTSVSSLTALLAWLMLL